MPVSVTPVQPLMSRYLIPGRCDKATSVSWVQKRMKMVWTPARCLNAASVMVITLFNPSVCVEEEIVYVLRMGACTKEAARQKS